MQQSMPRSMMTRRQTFGLAGLLYPLLPLQAFGQRNRDRDLITMALDEVSLVEKRAIDAAMTYPDNNIFTYLSSDFYARRKTLEAARSSEIFTTVERSITFVKAAPTLVPDWHRARLDPVTVDIQISIIKKLEAENLPVTPPSTAVTPAPIPSLVPGVGESDIVVLGDIIFEILGIVVSDKSLIVEFMNRDTAIQAALEKALSAITTKSWDDLAPAVEDCLKLMVAFLVTARSKLADTAARGMLQRLAVGCVPIIGWGYIAGCVIVSIWANYHRFSFAK
jgi:hypothetical protein